MDKYMHGPLKGPTSQSLCKLYILLSYNTEKLSVKIYNNFNFNKNMLSSLKLSK